MPGLTDEALSPTRSKETGKSNSWGMGFHIDIWF